MDYLKKNLPTLLTSLAMLALFVAKSKGLLSKDQAGMVASALGIGGVFGAHRMQPPSPPSSGATGAVASGLVAGYLGLVMACTPAQRASIPIVRDVDAVGITVAHVLGWCEDHGAPPDVLDQARAALNDKHTGEAIELAYQALKVAADHGENVPRELVAIVETARKAAQADAVAAGLRVLSDPSKHWADKGDAGTL